MSKVLVIKGANFSTNAVTQIEFDDPVPCTGISFSTDTIDITGYSPVTISYSVTPNDTTDEVLWSSSDSNVVTVSNGTLTVVGIGTCTVTATCGSYSATATVTVSIEYIESYFFGQPGTTATQGAGTVSTASDRVCALGDGTQKTDYKLGNGSGTTGDHYAILLPKNTNYVRIAYVNKSNLYDSSSGGRIVWYENNNVGEGALADYIKILPDYSESYNPYSDTVKTVAVPTGAEAIAVSARIRSAGESTAAEIMEGLGFSLEFLTAAE